MCSACGVRSVHSVLARPHSCPGSALSPAVHRSLLPFPPSLPTPPTPPPGVAPLRRNSDVRRGRGGSTVLGRATRSGDTGAYQLCQSGCRVRHCHWLYGTTAQWRDAASTRGTAGGTRGYSRVLGGTLEGTRAGVLAPTRGYLLGGTRGY